MKKGFTLIELLAVIVLLSIILAISIPSISGIVFSANKSAVTSSASFVIDAVKKYHLYAMMSNLPNGGETIFVCDGNSCTDGSYTLPINGTLPTTGIIYISDTGKIIIYEELTFGKFICVNADDIKCELGEVNYAIEIRTVEDLVAFGQAVDNDEEAVLQGVALMNDIDFDDDSSYDDPSSTDYGDINGDGVVEGIKTEVTTSKGFNPIGDEFNIFFGTFNGLGHTISNIYIDRQKLGQALFANVSGTIKNVNVTGSVTGQAIVALLVGNLAGGHIMNSSAEGTVEATEDTVSLLAGVAYGMTEESTIINCQVKGEVSAEQGAAGGLVGALSYAYLENNQADVTVSSIYNIGGLVGYTDYDCILSDNHVTATLNGKESIGGITGELAPYSIVENSSATVTINIPNGGGNAGGLIGFIVGELYNSFANVNITASTETGFSGHIGGIVGFVGCTDCPHEQIIIENCYALGNITAVEEIGGLVGQNGAESENEKTKYLTIKNSYALTNVSGPGISIGGLVGVDVMHVQNALAVGNVSGDTIGNTIGRATSAEALFINLYSTNNQVLTGTTVNTTGTMISRDLMTPIWFKDTLGLGDSFKYEDGYYPLIYKADEYGNPTTQLVANQVKIPIQ